MQVLYSLEVYLKIFVQFQASKKLYNLKKQEIMKTFEKIWKKSFVLWKKCFDSNTEVRKSTWVSVPNTETWFWLHTRCLTVNSLLSNNFKDLNCILHYTACQHTLSDLYQNCQKEFVIWILKKVLRNVWTLSK